MTSNEIINALMRQSPAIPRQALLEAAGHREELVPQLLESLDYIYHNGKQIMRKNPDYDLHFYALFLLAQFREKRAFPLLVRLLKENEETLDFFWGDALLDSYSRCLCCVYDGNLTDYPCLDAAEAERGIEAETAAADGGKYAGWRPKNQRFITEFYSPKAIAIDIPVYKALYRRRIPLWVKRNPRKEDLERIALLREALALFTQTCAEEGIETFEDFDRKYMVHYASARWVRRLRELLEKYRVSLPETDRALQNELAAMLERMGGIDFNRGKQLIFNR